MITQTTLDYPVEDIADLVRAAQAGDSDAFSELVVRFQPSIYALAMRRLGQHAEAQELCQEVLVKAFEKLGQLKTPEAFAGWIRSITVRMAINRRTRRAPTVNTESEALEASCIEQTTPLQHALDREQERRVHAGLDRLGKLDRETLKAFYFRGQSLLEMSDEFASPVGTIKRRLHVARQRLAKELEMLVAV
jgi:RNA polymerase sigma-70 factor (ECF subfamily)